jgi:hypothetical protein
MAEGSGIGGRQLRRHLLVAAAGSPEETASVLRRLAGSTMIDVLTSEGSGAGECLRAAPPSPLHLELDGKGLRYCCNHKPPHCSGYIAPAT